MKHNTGIVGDMLTCGSTYVRTCGHTLRYPAIGMPLGSTAHADAYVYESGLLLHSSVSRCAKDRGTCTENIQVNHCMHHSKVVTCAHLFGVL